MKRIHSHLYFSIDVSDQMMDHKEKFSRAGLETEFVGEAQHDPRAISSVKEGKVQLLCISPESLLWPQTRACAHTMVNNASFFLSSQSIDSQE